MKRTWLRRLALTVLAVVVLLVATSVAVGAWLSAPTWQGPPTDHFDGETFFTPGAPPRAGGPGDLDGLRAFLRWQLNREPGEWPPYRDVPPGPKPPSRVDAGAMRVTFINHATTLIQLDGVNVLTDPIYADRASPFSFAGPHRVRPPGIRFEDLPRIDAVVLSHNHYDHLDVATLRRVAAAWPGVRILCGLGIKTFLDAQGLPGVDELDWRDSRAVNGVTLHSVPNQHFSGRGTMDTDGTLWTAWVLEGSNGVAYFAGDTGYGPHFRKVFERFGPVRLAVLPVGAYQPEWFMGPIHVSPSEAVSAALDLEARLAVPMHHGTFPLADDGETQPIAALRAELGRRPAPFAVLDFGEGRDVP